MPRRDDIHKILLIGSGPIVIGQACEFDYSGTQACKVLAEDGFEVVLVNSNPATIMTDPAMAARTYVEPITPEFVEQIIAKEHPDAILPTLGGQTGLNCAVALAESGVLERYGVEMIGVNLASIQRGEDRKLFAEAMEEIGLSCAKSGFAYTIAEAEQLASGLGYPVVLRPTIRSRRRRRYRLQPGRTRRDRASGARPFAGFRGPRGRIRHRLERVRDGGDAR